MKLSIYVLTFKLLSLATQFLYYGIALKKPKLKSP